MSGEIQDPQARMESLLDIADEPVQTEQPTEQSTEQTEQSEQQPEQTAAEKAEEIRLLKFKHDGQEYEKPEPEIIELAQKGYDYTVKTQKLADERREFDAKMQTLAEQERVFTETQKIHKEMINEIAAITSLDQQLASYKDVNWTALSDSDPIEAQKLFFNMSQLQAKRSQLANEAQQKEQELFQNMSNQATLRMKEAAAILDKDLPEWKGNLKQTLIDTAKAYGANDRSVSVVTEAWIVKALADAAKWRNLQNSPVTKNKIADAKPVVKPGASDTNAANNASVRQDREMLKKSGKSDYAAKLIEQML